MQLMRLPLGKRRDDVSRTSLGYRYTPNTVLVKFSTMVDLPKPPGHPPGARRPTAWRTFRVLMEAPPGQKENLDLLEQLIAQELAANFASFGDYCRDGLPDLHYDVHTKKPVVVWNGSETNLTDDDIFALLCQGSHKERKEVLAKQAKYFETKKLFGYVDDWAAKHRSFRYHIRGADVSTLERLLPDEIALHKDQCENMCMYQMLRNRNPPRPEQRMYFKDFDPQVVHQWMLDNHHPVGAITDGLTAEDVQAHAVALGYNHAALDLTRSIILLHMPEKPRKDFKTIAYTVVGSHAIPFTDPDVIHSIMESAANRLGKRRMTNYAYYGKGNQPDPPAGVVVQSSSADTRSQDGIHRRKRRNSSLDEVVRADRTSLADLREEGWRADAPIDFEVEDREEEFEDTGSQDSVRAGSNKRKKARQYPLVSQRDRFRTFTKADGKDFIRDHLRPDYTQGFDPTLMYYFVCTDERNIEFLYDYCIHVLVWDPTTAARSFNGQCTTLTINNVIWTAQPDFEELLKLHSLFHPKEPFQLCGVASYAYRMLYRELSKVGRYGTSIWDCMSQYPPNLQRLLDNHHPFHRPKLLQKTFHAPYGPPADPTKPFDECPPEVLIPESERHRIDLIRSYTAALLEMNDDKDQFPIHDCTNVVVPFDGGMHGHIPVGHYLVDIPDKQAMEARGIYEDWQRLCCFQAGEPRMMSHRFLKALLHRNLLTLADVRLACVTDPERQKRYGTALVTGFTNFVSHIYHHEDLQDPKDPCAKMLVNYLVGLCNGTTLPHSGNRFVFRSLEEMYQLMLRIYTEDQIRKIHCRRVVGVDRYWDNRTYCHYELSASGLTYRSFHFQPVYNIVLENQAIRLFDRIRPIPLHALIQINIDACEYRVRPADRNAGWVQDLHKGRQSKEGRSPAELYDQRILGGYQSEAPKGPEKWRTYHYEYQNVRQETLIKRMLHDADLNHAAPALEDPESRDWLADWKDTLRVFKPGPLVRDAAQMQTLCVDWFKDGETERTGLILTGPAGTGKTHILRRLYDYAVGQGLNVVRTAYTHAACCQLGPDAMTLSALFGIDHLTDHRSLMVMSRRFAAHIRNLHIDLLIIDEISMIPMDLLECLMLFHRVASQTRIVLSGDFNQLPPVEPHRGDRPDGYNYFDTTDIFPYLVYDRVRNIGGRWFQLTECMRTDDPLLQEICLDPTFVTTRLDPKQFPVTPGTTMYRFICATNQTRKAVNWYCGIRWLIDHPDAVQHYFDLKDLYVQDKTATVTGINGRQYPARNTNTDHHAQEFEAMMARFEKGFWRKTKEEQQALAYKACPKHWQYLQNFVYAVGMEVVSRNTIREKTGGRTRRHGPDTPPLVVNNRRARIRLLDAEGKTVILEWLDVSKRVAEGRDDDRVNDRDLAKEVSEFEDGFVTLTFMDFAFNFVPGFCITSHMAQGETIREHYGIIDWNQIVRSQTMAYVAVTRASHPDFLHIIANYFADPWDVRSNADVGINLLRKLYHILKNEATERPLPWHRIPLDLYKNLKTALDTDATAFCGRCSGPMKLKGYMDMDNAQFSLLLNQKWYTDGGDIFAVVCRACQLSALEEFRGPRPGDISKKFPPTASSLLPPSATSDSMAV